MPGAVAARNQGGKSAEPAKARGGSPSGGTFFPAEAERPERPRTRAVTHVMDRFAPISEAELATMAPYVDIVKLGWGLPLLTSRGTVERRIAAYHRLGWEVSTGGTLLEHAVVHGREEAMIREAQALGFDLIEVSEGVIDLTPEQIASLTGEVRARELDVLIEVGKKNPHNQHSLRETLERVAHALKQNPRKVILESRESGKGVGIYDPDGAIKWDWVHALAASHPLPQLLFEAPLEAQQIGLLVDLGSDINLGNVAFDSVLPLASQRRGLRGDTFGLTQRHREVSGSPAAKFVHFLLETHRNLDQGEIMRLSRLPRRTVQSALEELKRQGRVREMVSFTDARKREYRLL